MNNQCPTCGVGFDPLQGKYAPDGTIVCAPCGDSIAKSVAATQKKNTGSAFVGAWGSLLIALLSFVIQFKLVFFLMPAIAVVGGGGTAYTALSSPTAAEALGIKRIPTVVLGGIAALLGLVSLVYSFSG